MKKIMMMGLIFSLVGAAPSAHAIDIAAVGILGLPKQSIDPDPAPTQVSGRLGLGWGTLVTLDMAPMIGLQVGALMTRRSTKSQTGATTTTSTAKALELPVVVRVSPIDMISLGVGGYFRAGLGKISQKTETGSVSTESDMSFTSAGFSSTDLGILGSVAIKFPIAPTLSLLGDIRYLFGLKDQSVSSANVSKTRDVQFLVGVNFGI